MESDPLPTPKQREAPCKMIHHAFVDMRMLGWAKRSEQIADLAEAFHNFPTEIYDSRFFRWSHFQEDLQNYQRKWEGKTFERNYVEELEKIRLAP